MTEVVKLILPASFPFLICGSLVCVLLMYGSAPFRAVGRNALAILIGLYCVLSVPIAVDAFAWPLRHSTVAQSVKEDAPRVIVLLTGRCDRTELDGRRVGVSSPMTRLRVLKTALVYSHTNAAVIVSGATATGTPETEIIKGELMASGVPADHIVIESDSRNTHESAIYVSRLLNGRPAFLVTSAMHMRRAVASFRKAGARVVPVPAPDSFGDTDRRFATLVTPSLPALQVGESAIYEYFGLAYYWSHGWL